MFRLKVILIEYNQKFYFIKYEHHGVGMNIITVRFCFLILICILSACSQSEPIQDTEKKLKSIISNDGQFEAYIQKVDIQQGKIVYPSLYQIYVSKIGEEARYYVEGYGWNKLPILRWSKSNVLNINYSTGTITRFCDSFNNHNGVINLSYTPEKNITDSQEEKIYPELNYNESINDKITDIFAAMLHYLITRNTILSRVSSPDLKRDAVLVRSDAGGAGESYLLYVVAHNSNKFVNTNMIGYQFYKNLPKINWVDAANVEIHYTDGSVYDFQDSVWEKQRATGTQLRKVRLHLFHDELTS